MNFLEPWSIVWFVGFFVYTSIRHVYQERVKGTRKKGEIDTLEKILLFFVFSTSLLPLLYFFSNLIDFANVDYPLALNIVGLLSMIAGLWLFERSHRDLGTNWSVSLQLSEEHELIDKGVYRSIRHPMYAAIWLWNLGQGLLIENWIAGWAISIAFGAMYILRVPREEAMMRDTFGAAYDDYARRTGRIIPRLKTDD